MANPILEIIDVIAHGFGQIDSILICNLLAFLGQLLISCREPFRQSHLDGLDSLIGWPKYGRTP